MIRKLFALFALVGLAVAPSMTWAGGRYARLTVTAVPSDAGTVAVVKGNGGNPTSFGAVQSADNSKTQTIGTPSKQDLPFTVSAKPAEGYKFVGWYENDSCTGSAISGQAENYEHNVYAESSTKGSPTEGSLYAKFVDKSQKIPLSEVVISLSAEELAYTGAPQTVSVVTELTEGMDYTVSGDSLTQTGSALSNETYKVIINAVDGSGYTGSAMREWTIRAPSGEFAADALSTTTEGCAVSGNAVTVTDSTKLAYDSTKKVWIATMAVTWPIKTTEAGLGKSGTAQCTDPQYARVQVGESVYTGTQVVDGVAAGSGLFGESKEGSYKTSSIGGSTKTYTYLDTVTHACEITIEKIEAAKTAGSLSFPITVYGLAWGNDTLGNPSGLKPTTYKIVVPIDENLVLNDENGDEVYPSNHKHLWDIAAAGNVLTASCTNESTDCSIEGRKITLTLAAENQDYTGNALTVSLAGKDDFDQYLKDRISYGTITYEKPTYSQGNDQWYTGDYTAVVTVTVDSVAYELTKAFSITKPEGGYTSGFEVSDISFKTTQEALDFAPAGGTVVCHSEIEGVTLDFKTDKDVTLDLNGKTLTGDNDMTIKNSGSGEVTLTGGTFQQPRKLLNAKQVTIATGKFIFTDLTLENVATQGDNHFTVTVADGAELKVTSGTYEAEFKGKVEISGGRFGLHIGAIIGSGYDLPAPDAKLLAQDRIILTSKEDDTTIYTVVEHHHSIVYGAAENVITAVCDAADHESCGFGAPKLTLTAENAVTTGSPYTGAKVETDEGFPVAAEDVTIVYYAQDDLETPLEGAPSEAGEYVAKVTVEGVTAEKAFQIVHEHVFVFGAADNVLTAACTAAGTCDSRSLAVTLVAENRDWQKATPFEASVTDGFGEVIAHTVGGFVYKQNGETLAAAPILTGEYSVEVTVTVDSVDYTLVKAFAITKPEGGYTSGYEAGNGLCYDTFAEAFAATDEGGTLFCHDPFDNQATFDFTSAKNITIDLCGNELTYSKSEASASDLTIVNNGDGIVTLKNGTIVQPKGQNKLTILSPWRDVFYNVNVSGKFVFGEKMVVESIGTEDDFLVVTASAVEKQPVLLAAAEVLLGAEQEKTLKITDGFYKTTFAGGVEITGGNFTEDPSAFLAEGYAIGKQKEEGYPFHVFEHVHEFSFTAEGNAITCHCTDPDCYYDGVSTKLVAEDVIYDGASHGAWLDPQPGDGFPNVKIGITYKLAESGFDINGIPSEIGEYIATATVDASVAPDVKVSVRYRITDGRPFDLSAIQPRGGEAAGRVLERSTLTVTNGTALKYCTADEAPDGSGIEGWYVGMKVTWPNETFDLTGFNFTGPKHALFTVNGIKGEGDAKRIFTGEDDIPGISVDKRGFTLFGIDLTRIDSFTWWERITVADVKAADKAGAAAIEREVTAWGEKWEDKAGLVTYGDTDGVAPYVFRIIVNLKDLELSDGTYIYWPEHEHNWSYAVNENSITATCSVAGCPYAVGVWAEFGPKTVASRLANTEPLEAVFRGIETFVGATEATAGEIEYWQGGTKLDAAPIQPGAYTAKSTVTLKDGTTTYEFTTPLTIREGNVVVDGQHYDKPADVLEAQTQDELNIVVWKDFTAEKVYELPANGTKILDLDGKTVRQPEGEDTLLTNLGALTIVDSSVTPQETAKGTYKGRLYGDIVNEGVLTITGGYIDGEIVNEGGIVNISGGVFRIKPDESWLASGCKIIVRKNLYSVERHLHQYALVRSLGGSLVFATCVNILVDGKLEVTECDAREVIFLLSPMKGLLAGAISLPTTSLEYNGREQGAELTAINLWELRKLLALPTLADLGEAWDLIQKLIDLIDDEGQITGGTELLTEILEALTKRGFNPADFILTADKVAALTGIDIGPAIYTRDGQPVEGVPVNAGTYKVTRTLASDIGMTQTITCTYTINPMDINDANPTIVCDPESKSVEYDTEPHEIVVAKVTLDSPAAVKARKLLDAARNLIKNPTLDGALGILSQLNDMAADLPPAPDFWRDYGFLKISQYLADFVKYIPETLVPYLESQLSKAELVENVDYTVGGVTRATDIGSYVLTVNGMGNYKGTISVEWVIVYDHGGAGHNWKYEADGATLTATCQQDPNCLISPVVAELSADPATKEFDNAPLTASVANAFTFTAYTGMTFGEVYYEDAEGNPLASAPIDVGRYTAKVDMTTESETHTLVLPLEITYPEGGFKNGFEVVDFGATRGIRYNTLAEALENASADCTIYARDDISGPTFDFTTDKDVTIDLCGRKIASDASRIISADQTMVFRNDGTGKVTFVNGTIEQPRHYILGVQSADQMTLASGAFAFGEGIFLKNVATLPGNYFEITVAPEASLAIAAGMYEATFVGNVSIGGGKFRRRPDESHLQPNYGIVPVLLEDGTLGYAVRFHQHDYKFVHIGPLLIGVCVSRDQDQGLLEISACRAKVVAMCEVVPGKVFDGMPADDADVYYLNLSEMLDLFPDIDWEVLVDDIKDLDRTALVQDILGMIFGTDDDVPEDKAFLSKDEFEELTGATVGDPYFTTNASLIDDIIGDGDQRLDAAPVDAGRYKFCIDVDTPSGNRITVCNAFSITPASMTDVEIVCQPEQTSFVYSGSDVGYTGLVATYGPDGAPEPLVLEEGRDYTVSGTLQALELGEYSFTVKGMGNYAGSRTFAWQIVEPSGDFPEGLLRPAPSALGEYGAVIGDTVVVRRSQELTYDKATGTWRAGLELAWPSDAGYRISPESVCVTLSTQSRMYRGSDILAGDVDGEYLKVATDADGFLSTLTWEVVLSADKIRTDVLSGIPQYDYELTAFAGASEECPGGLKKARFGLVIPLGNLALYNDTGSRKYPAHVHEWSFEEPVEGRLEAKCVSRSAGKKCREGVALTLGDEDSSEYAYTGLPIELPVGNLKAFYLMTGALIGDIVYRQDGTALEGAPIKAGDYEAVIEILPMNAEPYTFTRAFTILPPEGGSYETMSVQLLTRKQENLVASYDDETVRTRLRSLCGENNEFVLQVASWLKARGLTQAQLKASSFLKAALELNTGLLDGAKVVIDDLKMAADGEMQFKLAVRKGDAHEQINASRETLAKYLRVSTDGGLTFRQVVPEDLSVVPETGIIRYQRTSGVPGALLRFVVDK